jgi:hypothetical protein
MPAMSLRHAPLPSAKTALTALTALTAGLTLLLSGCGGSSGPSTAATQPATASGSPSPSPTPSGTGKLLTGHFCADLNHLGQVAGLTAKQARQMKHDRHAAVSYLRQTARDFAALGREGGPQVTRFMTVLAGQYEGLATATAHGEPLAKLEREAPGLTSRGAAGAAFRGLATYMQKHCS